MQLFPDGSGLCRLFDLIRTRLQELKARDGTMLRKAVKDHIGVSYSEDIEALVRVGYNHREVFNKHYLSRSNNI